jgi:hypothetical protein
VDLNIHFDLAELVVYTVVAGVVWHLIGNLVQGAALHLNTALLHKRQLKKLAVEVALEEQRAKYQREAKKEYQEMVALHVASETARQSSLEALPEVKN